MAKHYKATKVSILHHPEGSHKAEHCNGTIRMLFLHNWKSQTLQRPKSALCSHRMKPWSQTLQRNSHLHAKRAKWKYRWKPNHTSSQAQTRVIHIWYQMCWHYNYSNITCLLVFTVQSTLWQTCHMSILYTSYSIHTVSQKRWPLSGCYTTKDQRNEVEFLDVQVQMGAKGDYNTMHATITLCDRTSPNTPINRQSETSSVSSTL
jgi:hypothetical protein